MKRSHFRLALPWTAPSLRTSVWRIHVLSASRICPHTGDAITADTTTSMEILNVFVESGVNSSAHVPLEGKPEVAFNPNADENMPLLYPDGSSLSPSDVDALFRQQAKLITDLTNRVPVSLR